MSVTVLSKATTASFAQDAVSAAIGPSPQASANTMESLISNHHGNGSQFLFQTSLCNPTVTPQACQVFESYPLQVGQPYPETIETFQIQWADVVGYSGETVVNNRFERRFMLHDEHEVARFGKRRN